ncbi:MAG TPA: FAD-binding protein [Candidatus Saccharimonadales bacterium]|jgi:UDP-N-acetylmuramate dehydrogenase
MEENVPLAPLTSLAAGGSAERLYMCHSGEELQAALTKADGDQLWVLGYGANVLVSDAGLPGTTVLMRGGKTTRDGDIVIADAGVWWDDLVQFAIHENLWGLELMSAIPGGVGAAVAGNIAAYGQAVADTLAWVEVFDRDSHKTRRLVPAELNLSYRYSTFQTPEFAGLIILRAAFALHRTPNKQLEYDAALAVAHDKNYDLSSLDGRRQTILDTRAGAGSLWDYRHPNDYLHTAGSFFRNPIVTEAQAAAVMAHDETGRSLEVLSKMNKLHGGSGKRVSAALVLLAAGFQRGQTWGPVRLHPDHILKIENTGGATAQEIYVAAQEIIHTVKQKLDVELLPEVRFLGAF